MVAIRYNYGEQDGRLVGNAVGDPDGELLGHWRWL